MAFFFFWVMWEEFLFGTESCVSIGGVHGVHIEERERERERERATLEMKEFNYFLYIFRREFNDLMT